MQFSVLFGAATAVNSCLDVQLGPDEVTPYRREHYLLLGAQYEFNRDKMSIREGVEVHLKSHGYP